MGLSAEDKKDIKEIVGEAVDGLARIVQKGFEMTATKADMHAEFERVHERLIKLDDSVSYSSQSFILLTHDLEDTKQRLTRVEEHLGISIK
ncbi:MAG: hypothetical protein Q8P01_06210 [bacterium]|nr:hypothetical protein [bacterium]